MFSNRAPFANKVPEYASKLNLDPDAQRRMYVNITKRLAYSWFVYLSRVAVGLRLGCRLQPDGHLLQPGNQAGQLFHTRHSPVYITTQKKEY